MNRTRVLQVFTLLLGLATLRCADDGTSSNPDGNGQGSGGSMAPGMGGAMPGSGGNPGGGVPGGGGFTPGGGGFTPGGGGAQPGAGGFNPGGAGSGGAGPSAGGAVVGPVDPVGNANRAPGFINLTPPMGAPLPDQGTALNPAAPTGWQYHPIDGAICRDGSPMGIFVRKGTGSDLVIYFEGGGACSNTGFCRFNPKNVGEILAGDGASVLGSAAGAVAGRQQPGNYTPSSTPSGIFDATNAANPFKDSSIVFIPYCTGDVHSGTRANATVPWKVNGNVDPRDIPQHQFVGALNTQKIIGRVYPTFSSVTRVVVTGVSAGSFGAALHYSMIQDTFGNTPVTAILDSGIPFDDQYMPACMQRKWRDNWGLALPPDCTECQQADGGGFLGMADFLMRKHPNGKLALISTMEDEVIRLFFSVGLQSCGNYDGGDPVEIFLGGADPNIYMPPASYSSAMTALRTRFQASGRLATFFMPGPVHQHVFRPSFYTSTVGGKTMPQFVSEFLAGTVAQLGP